MRTAIDRWGQRYCLPRTAVAAVLLLVAPLFPARAQEAGDAVPAAPSAPSADTEIPYLFAPDVTNPVNAADLVRSLNTPSGMSPFFDTSTVPRGLHFNIDQSIRYDDNAERVPKGGTVPLGRSKGDFYSVTSFGGSASAIVGLQTLFVKGYYGLTRYNQDVDLNSDRYNVSGGINWRTGDVCSGSFVLSANQSELALQDLGFGTNGTALTKSERADFNGRCHLFNRFYATFGAGALDYKVSSTPSNDYSQFSVRAGLEYAVPKLHTLGFQVANYNNDFSNRIPSLLNPLTTSLTQQDYRAYYTYYVSPKTTINISGGATTFENSSSFSNSSKTIPTYAASISWRATPKIMFNLSTQYGVGPPQGVTADYSSSMISSVGMIYNFSRKLSFSAIYAHSRTSSSVFSSVLGSFLSQQTRVDTASIDANYRFTPFLYGNLGYRFTDRTDSITGQKSVSNLYTVGLSYRR
jgi:hypothetical protein